MEKGVAYMQLVEFCDRCCGGWDWTPRDGEPTQLDIDDDGKETVIAVDPAICHKCRGVGWKNK